VALNGGGGSDDGTVEGGGAGLDFWKIFGFFIIFFLGSGTGFGGFRHRTSDPRSMILNISFLMQFFFIIKPIIIIFFFSTPK